MILLKLFGRIRCSMTQTRVQFIFCIHLILCRLKTACGAFFAGFKHFTLFPVIRILRGTTQKKKMIRYAFLTVRWTRIHHVSGGGIGLKDWILSSTDMTCYSRRRLTDKDTCTYSAQFTLTVQLHWRYMTWSATYCPADTCLVHEGTSW